MKINQLASFLTEQGIILEDDDFNYKVFTVGGTFSNDINDAETAYDPNEILCHDVKQHRGMFYLGIGPQGQVRDSKVSIVNLPPDWRVYDNSEFEAWLLQIIPVLKRKVGQYLGEIGPDENDLDVEILPDEDSWGYNRGGYYLPHLLKKLDIKEENLDKLAESLKEDPDLLAILSNRPRYARLRKKYALVLTICPENVHKVEEIKATI